MRILVTGATGFIGRYVTGFLLANGYSVIASATKSKTEAESINPLLKNTEYISKNLNDKEENYYAFFRKPDCIIHLSWEGLPNYNELFHIEKNLAVNYFFIKNMIQHGLPDITIAGTCFEYGLKNGCLNEKESCEPLTVYGLAKDTLRRFVETLQTKYQFTMKWARLFYLYGDGMGKQSLLAQLEEAVKNQNPEFNMSPGEQLRDYLPVETAAEYLCGIALQNKITGIINCCSGSPVSVRSMVEKFLEKRGYNMKLNRGFYPYPAYEPLAFWGDTAKLTQVLSSPPVEYIC